MFFVKYLKKWQIVVLFAVLLPNIVLANGEVLNYKETLIKAKELLKQGKVEDSIKIYEEGMVLTKECLDTIDKTKGKVVEIKKKLDNTITEEEFGDGE